ncbi:cell division protein CrgA [Salinifilum aidingensis]
MPKSKVRKKDRSAQTTAGARTPAKLKGPTHPLYLGVMFGLMLLGLLWLIVNYLAGDKIPFIAEMGAWNFAVGFGLMIVGLIMTMGWR